jgi:hypothetical protein
MENFILLASGNKINVQQALSNFLEQVGGEMLAAGIVSFFNRRKG